MNKYTTLMAATCLFTFSSANAAMFDFEAIADGDNSYGVMGGEKGASSFTFTKDGLSVTATGYNGTTNEDYFAYLDSGNAGLGVCQNLTDNAQCSPASDDNVTFDETLKLVFDQEVTIDTTIFVNGSHGTTFDGDFELSIDGVSNIYSLTNIFEQDLTGTTFEFYNPNVGGDSNVSNTEQFYISSVNVSPVPVPAAAWLFASGLIGMVGVARRNNTQM